VDGRCHIAGARSRTGWAAVVRVSIGAIRGRVVVVVRGRVIAPASSRLRSQRETTVREPPSAVLVRVAEGIASRDGAGGARRRRVRRTRAKRRVAGQVGQHRALRRAAYGAAWGRGSAVGYPVHLESGRAHGGEQRAAGGVERTPGIGVIADADMELAGRTRRSRLGQGSTRLGLGQSGARVTVGGSWGEGEPWRAPRRPPHVVECERLAFDQRPAQTSVSAPDKVVDLVLGQG